MVEQKASPTLKQGHSYVSVVAPVPSALCQKISAWNSRFGEEPATIGNHITLLITEVQDAATLVDRAQALDFAQGAIPVELGKPQTFLPATPVTYLPIVRGDEGLKRAHQLLQEKLGESASPFAYVPHLTLSHRLTEEYLEDARIFFESLTTADCSFALEEFKVYSNTAGVWELLTALKLS